MERLERLKKLSGFLEVLQGLDTKDRERASRALKAQIAKLQEQKLPAQVEVRDSDFALEGRSAEEEELEQHDEYLTVAREELSVAAAHHGSSPPTLQEIYEAISDDPHSEPPRDRNVFSADQAESSREGLPDPALEHQLGLDLEEDMVREVQQQQLIAEEEADEEMRLPTEGAVEEKPEKKAKKKQLEAKVKGQKQVPEETLQQRIERLSTELSTLYHEFQTKSAALAALPEPSGTPTKPEKAPRRPPAISETKRQSQLTAQEGEVWIDLVDSPAKEDTVSGNAVKVTSMAESSFSMNESFEVRNNPVTTKIFNECKLMLKALGVPILTPNGPFEGEALAASLVKHGLADYVASEDTVRNSCHLQTDNSRSARMFLSSRLLLFVTSHRAPPPSSLSTDRASANLSTSQHLPT